MANILVFNKTAFGISETFIYKQVKALSEKNKVFVATYETTSLFPVEKFSVIKLKKRPFSGRLKVLNNVFLNSPQKKEQFAHTQLTRIIKQKKISLIHAHYGTGGLVVLKAAKEMDIPLVVSFHGYDASAKLKVAEYARQLPELFDYASGIIICSNHMIQTLTLQKWMSKVHFLPYGIDTSFFKPTSWTKIDKVVRLLHSGRVVAKKGVVDLIKVFHQLLLTHNNIQLDIVGAGDDLEQCKALMQTLQVPEDKLLFHGAQPHEMVKAFINKADIFILNSRVAPNGDMEGLPNTILEAMSMGKAVVSTYHAGIPDAITSGIDGVLVKENDNEALKSALEELINNAEKRSMLGQNGRRTVVEKFDEKEMSKKLQNIFIQLREEVVVS